MLIDVLFFLMPVLHPQNGSIVVERAPDRKTNPTIIFPCPNAPPGFNCG